VIDVAVAKDFCVGVLLLQSTYPLDPIIFFTPTNPRKQPEILQTSSKQHWYEARNK
jgi:hypothetical protein